MYWILFVVGFCIIYAIILFMLFYCDDEVCKIRERKRKIRKTITVNDKVRIYEARLLLKQAKREKKVRFKNNMELLKKYDLSTCVLLNQKLFNKIDCSKKEKK